MIELLVAIGVFGVISVGFMSVMFGATRGSNRAQSVSAVSNEARLGFNRMVRDVREAQAIDPVPAPGPTSFQVFVDFDGNLTRPTPASGTNSQGDFEELTYSYDVAKKQILLNDQVLMEGVDCPRTTLGVCSQTLLGSAPWSTSAYGTNPPNVFAFLSNRLEYDWNKDGVTTWQELDVASASPHNVIGIGNNNGILDAAELPFVTSIGFNLVVANGGAATSFQAQAQLRNQR
jgi:type II secretory pathway pseudopilin PulG